MSKRLLATSLLFACACADAPLDARFTSRVVQRETCTSTGGRAETCTVEEALSQLEVILEEVEDRRVWLYGVPVDGTADRAVLGTRDSAGGFLFVARHEELNGATGCGLKQETMWSLAIDPSATKDAIGTDPCVPLLGREVSTTTTTAACETARTPPEGAVRTTRRRWEAPIECGVEDGE
jgi:hypothetical protein